MARGTRARRRLASRQYRPTPYPLPSLHGRKGLQKEVIQKKSSKAPEKDWEDATCSVCMEFPHNAVLLLCSSHDKGCRPYMCGTSYRYSNCLNQFKKAYTKEMSPPPGQVQDVLGHESAENTGAGSDGGWPSEKHEVVELACPLCRGQVKGWTVVEAAREHLNAKKRSCTQDDCSFVGAYKELRKHVRAEHPFARPHEVDPVLEQKWRRLERERERDDVISTIRSSMPGAMVLGDYVIEGGRYGFHSENGEGQADDEMNYEVGVEESNLLNVLFLLQAFGPSRNASFMSRLRRLESRMLEEVGSRSSRSIPGTRTGVADVSEGDEVPQANEGRILALGRSERRRRRRSRRRSIIDVI
ncbi:hypothetical protein ACLOJK_018125 [Asimina triloba]